MNNYQFIWKEVNEGGGKKKIKAHTYTQELHYDFHVCNTAEAIKKKFTGSCWNVLIQVNGVKERGRS